MNRNTYCHVIAAVNETLLKQAALNKQAGPKMDSVKNAITGGAGKAWGAAEANPWVSIPGAGAAAGALGGGLYGGLSEDGSVPLGMLGGAAMGGALGAGGMGAYRMAGGMSKGSPLLQYLVQNHPAVAQKAWYMNPMLGMGLGGAALGAGAGYAAGDGYGALGGALLGGAAGAGAGYGGRAYANNLYNKRNWILPG